MQKEGIKMNKSFRISDKSMQIALIVGSCLLAVTILVLSIAVSANNRREKDALHTEGSGTTVSTPSTDNPSDPDGSSPTIVNPTKPGIDQMIFVQPVEGGLLQVHDLETLAYSVTMNDYRVHTGIDIETEAGAAVYACASGSVSEIYTDHLMGNTVVIDHGNGVQSVYCNLDDTLPEGLEVGTSVRVGQLLGAVGTSALIEVGEQPHLHFELLDNGAQVDPAAYLDYTSVSETVED